MDFSAANSALWDPVIQIGIIAGLILVANVLRRKIPLIRKSLMPIVVLAGFILLGLRCTGLFSINLEFLESITYHGLAVGFIALSLRVPEKHSQQSVHGSKSGAVIVSTYLVQAIAGLILTVTLSLTLFPDLFSASGILLPMAYGQGPGQANNVGTTYQALGMEGGRSFGLSLAAAGYLCACVGGVLLLGILHRRGKLCRASEKELISGSVTVDTFQDQNEIPISESVDKLSVQIALVALLYLLTYLVTWGICSLLSAVAPGLAGTVSTLLWGFNFIIGSVLAMACRGVFKGLQKAKIMTRQYQNNYLLSRISGFAFDLMIVAGIASINLEDISGYWLPFLLLALVGGTVTLLHLWAVCRRLYPDYRWESFFGMFGMLTGTLSSGVLLLREVDPDLRTPASNDLVVGSSFGIVFGAPVLLLVSFAAESTTAAVATVAAAALYLAFLIWFIFRKPKIKKK